MRVLWSVAAVAALAIGLASAARADNKPISGQVVDAKGNGVAGAEVSVGWNCAGKDNRLEPAQKIRTDRTGRFSGTVPCGDQPVPILALDKDRKVGGLVVVKPEDLGKTVKITAGELVTLRGEIDPSDFSEAPKSWKVQVLRDNVNLLSLDYPSTKLQLPLPPGAYEIQVSGPAGTADIKEVELDAAEPALEIGKIKPMDKEFKVGEAKRKAPEIFVSDAKGVSKNVKLSDYKGKWVVMEFWGFW